MFHEYRKRTVVCNVVVIVVARMRWYNEVEPRREPCLNSLKYDLDLVKKDQMQVRKKKNEKKKEIKITRFLFSHKHKNNFRKFFCEPEIPHIYAIISHTLLVTFLYISI